MIYTSAAEEKWALAKDEIRRTWSRLSAADLERTQGDDDKIQSLIQRKYGRASEQSALSKLDQIMAEFRREMKEEERIQKSQHERSKWCYRPF